MRGVWMENQLQWKMIPFSILNLPPKSCKCIAYIETPQWSGSSYSCTWTCLIRESCNLFWEHVSQVKSYSGTAQNVWTSDEPVPRTWWQMKSTMEMNVSEHQYNFTVPNIIFRSARQLTQNLENTNWTEYISYKFKKHGSKTDLWFQLW